MMTVILVVVAFLAGVFVGIVAMAAAVAAIVDEQRRKRPE